MVVATPSIHVYVKSTAKMATSEEKQSSWELIKQGAEAKIYKGAFLGTPVIIKERFNKSYRVPALDKKLTHRRMNQEARSMARCRKHGIKAPAVYHLDFEHHLIYMELIKEGVVMKDYINQLNPDTDWKMLEDVMRLIGVTIATMHNVDIVHGDLTTSNMIFNPDTSSLTMIDFGLSFTSSLAEDKGVDLYVLERAFLSTHPKTEELFQVVLESYSTSSKHSEAVISKLDEVRMRGRKRIMIG